MLLNIIKECDCMAVITASNIAIAKRGSGATAQKVSSVPVSFQAANELGIIITKTIDKTGEVYFQGETITFTITMTRVAGMSGAINQITLTDEVPAVVKFTKDNVQQTVGTGGNISVSGQTLTVDGLVLNNGNPTNTIIIKGTINVTS